MKKNWILTAGLCVFIVAAGVGCGAKEDGGQAVTVEQAEVPDLGQEENGQTQGNDVSQGDEQESGQSQAGDETKESNQPQDAGSSVNRETEMIDGNVKSIGNGSLILIKTTTEETDEGYSMAIAPVEGYESEEDLVDVGFAENVSYELRMVKNGGLNPDEDVSVKEASFADVEEGASLTVEGHYDGSTFIAEKVVIYEFL